ncbi:MAG TPA: carboxypeptidase-like regulatory domain-containing protein [Pyrinomonadaceae bacterium]|jgi:uncharacterized protein (DUF2141 family)
MVSSTRQAIAGILFVFAVSVYAHSQTATVKEPTATVSGKITIKGKGAPGIVVGLRQNTQRYSTESTIYRAVTDNDGEYRIVNVPAGNYLVLPFAPVYVSSADRAGKSLIVNKGETIENVDFTLARGGVITGKVVDSDGRPVIEEEVMVIPSSGRDGSYYLPGVQTDDRGVYRIFGLPAATYTVAVGRDENGSMRGRSRNSYKRTYYPGVADVTQAKGIEVTEGSEATNVDITLSRSLTTYTASGRIVDAETGQPLSSLYYGITQFVNPYSTSSWNNGSVSSDRGEFKFDGLLPGKYAVSIIPDKDHNWRAEPFRFEVVDQDVGDLLLKAKRGSILSGVIVPEGTEDKAIRDQLIRTGLGATVAGDDNQWSSQTAIARDGSFWITGLRGGLVTLFVSSSDCFRIVRVEHNGVIQSGGIELRDGEQLTGVKVVVQCANSSLRGVIEFENGGVPENARFGVRIRKPGDDERKVFSHDPSPQVDARGQFVIEGLMPGNYELVVSVYIPGSPPVIINKKQEVVVTAGSPNTVTVKVDLKADSARPN